MNKIYNCIIVDDDEIDRLTVQMHLKPFSFIKPEGSFSNPLEALEFATKKPVDIAFFDIDMPQLSGLQLRQQLLKIDVCVFITSYPNYAIDGFEVDAFDFLIKPIKGERFAKTIEKIEHYFTLKQKASLVDTTLGADFIYIKEGNNQLKISLSQIEYLEALKDYTSIVTSTKKYCVLQSIGNLLKEETFRSFIRVHKSFAVQKHTIKKINSYQVELLNIALPIGRTYKEAVFNAINS